MVSSLLLDYPLSNIITNGCNVLHDNVQLTLSVFVPLYRYKSNKKDSSIIEESLLVTSPGIEPGLPG